MKKFSTKLQNINENERKKSLNLSIVEASTWSVMYGFGETYITAFAVALKATSQQIGFLASFPRFLAALFQLHAAKVTDQSESRKKITIISVFLQALMFLPILLIPFLFDNNKIFVLTILFSLYWIFGQFAGPAWSSWMGDLVKEKERGSYFGKRNRIAGFVSFISVLIAGLTLQFFSNISIFLGFGILFGVAVVARLFSVYFLTKIYEPPYKNSNEDQFSFAQYVKKLPNTNYGKFVIYFSLLTFSAQIAAPFLTVFMLRDLSFSYATYTILISASSIATFMSMAYWGKHIDEFGNKKVLTITGLLIAIIPFLWLVSQSPYYLIIVQGFAGFGWAGFNLAAFNFLFDTVKPAKRTRCVAYQNVLLGTSIFIGASLGGSLTKILPDPQILVSNLQYLFIISGVLRLGSFVLMVPNLKK